MFNVYVYVIKCNRDPHSYDADFSHDVLAGSS